MLGIEGDIEMMFAGEPCRCRNAKRVPHDAFQRVLGKEIIAHQVFWHAGFRAMWSNSRRPYHSRPGMAKSSAEKWRVWNSMGTIGRGSAGFCCQVPANP